MAFASPATAGATKPHTQASTGIIDLFIASPFAADEVLSSPVVRTRPLFFDRLRHLNEHDDIGFADQHSKISSAPRCAEREHDDRRCGRPGPGRQSASRFSDTRSENHNHGHRYSSSAILKSSSRENPRRISACAVVFPTAQPRTDSRARRAKSAQLWYSVCA